MKVFLLIIAVAVLCAAIVIAINAGSGNSPAGTPRTQTFFEQFVIAGGPIVWFVLLPMSLIMVHLAVAQGFIIRRKRLLPAEAGKEIIEVIKKFGQARLQNRIADKKDCLSIAIVTAVNQGRGDFFRMRNAIFESLQEQALCLVRRIEWLNLIGNVSPMVGLFGTVFGMIKLFNAIVIAGGQPQPAQLADGISVALVTTFWGLFIAIPALTLHGIFRNRIEVLISDAANEAERVLLYLNRNLEKRTVVSQNKQKPSIQQLPPKTGRTPARPIPLK